MIAAVLVSCKKNTTETPVPAQSGEIEFNINSIYNDQADRNWTVPFCVPDATPVYAEIRIQLQSETDPHAGELLQVDVYYIGDQLYTKALQLPYYDPQGPNYVEGSNCYRIVEFNVYAEDETGAPFIYKATPAPHSEFDQFVENGLPLEFCVLPFEKQKLEIDVLCFIPDVYELFGFFWFEITEITVREMCFFGDLCLKSVGDYVGSLYAANGLFIDEAAIFKILAFHNGVAMNQGNAYYNTLGEPLCIKYPDYDYETDDFSFELWVYVKVGDGEGINGGNWDYVKMFTWVWQDDFELTYPDVDDDGVAEFVIGNCVLDGFDIQLAPWFNLPNTATVNHTSPGTSGSYFGITFGGFGTGYDIKTGVEYSGWCGDGYHYVNPSGYTALIRSSLDPMSEIPVPYLNKRKLECLNYMFNNYGSYGIDLMANSFTLGATGTQQQVQQSIWALVHSPNSLAPLDPSGLGPEWLGPSSFLPLSVEMAGAAFDDCPDGYLPYPGGWAAVFAIDEASRVDTPGQLILILIDP
jgi:hypothetical protein